MPKNAATKNAVITVSIATRNKISRRSETVVVESVFIGEANGNKKMVYESLSAHGRRGA